MWFERLERTSGSKMDSLGVPTLNLSKCFTRFERMPDNKVASLGVPTFNASIVCYTLWENARQQSCFPRAGHIQDLLCFTRFEMMPGNHSDSLGVPTLHISVVFYKLWERCLVTKLIHWFPGSAHLQRFQTALHPSREMLGNKVDCLGVPIFDVSVALHTLWEDARQPPWFPGSAHIQRSYCALLVQALRGCQKTNWIPWECPHVPPLLRFTRFERDARHRTWFPGSANVQRFHY